MAKHFEDIWQAAEQVAIKEKRDASLRYISIKNVIDRLENKQLIEYWKENLGELLFEIAGLAEYMNVNVADLLNSETEARKSQLLDPEE